MGWKCRAVVSCAKGRAMPGGGGSGKYLGAPRASRSRCGAAPPGGQQRWWRVRVAKLGLLGTRKSQPRKNPLETMSSQKNPNDFKGNHGKNQVRVENPKLCLVRNPSLEYEELLVFLEPVLGFILQENSYDRSGCLLPNLEISERDLLAARPIDQSTRPPPQRQAQWDGGQMGHWDKTKKTQGFLWHCAEYR